MNVLETIAALESLNVRQLAREAVEKNFRGMVSLNKTQLHEGHATSGRPFPKYAPFEVEEGKEYADFKEELNPRPGWGNPDLKLTGAFYRAIFADLEGDNIIMDSTDEKSEWLQEHYDGKIPGQLSLDEPGSRIFGLDPPNWKVFKAKVRADFCKEIEKRTGLTFTLD